MDTFSRSLKCNYLKLLQTQIEGKRVTDLVTIVIIVNLNMISNMNQSIMPKEILLGQSSLVGTNLDETVAFWQHLCYSTLMSLLAKMTTGLKIDCYGNCT